MNLTEILRGIKKVDQEWINKARERTGQLVMPARALGRLHDISEQLCGIRQTLQPSVADKAFLVMAGDHGVVDEGVSAYPREVTPEMLRTFLNGGAGINALAGLVGAKVWVVDMGVAGDLDLSTVKYPENFKGRKIAPGTANFALEPAMSREQAIEAVETGFQLASDLIADGVDLLGTGDMGIGNTTPSAAVGRVITGAPLAEMVGRGTGIDDQGLALKTEVIERSLEKHRPDPNDGLDVLSKIGGFEIGGLAGVILAAAFYQRPVIVDGFISTAGALIAHALCPETLDYMFAGHASEEPGHKHMLKYLGLTPILDLGMRLGEGTGAALAMNVIEGAVRMFTEMFTFEEAAVSGKL